MNQTTTADRSPIPVIEAFEEKLAIQIHWGGTPANQAKDLAAQDRGFRNQTTTGLG